MGGVSKVERKTISAIIVDVSRRNQVTSLGLLGVLKPKPTQALLGIELDCDCKRGAAAEAHQARSAFGYRHIQQRQMVANRFDDFKGHCLPAL